MKICLNQSISYLINLILQRFYNYFRAHMECNTLHGMDNDKMLAPLDFNVVGTNLFIVNAMLLLKYPLSRPTFVAAK